MIINADGTGLEVLIPKELASSRAYPVWSPDGEQIVFASTRDGQNEIYVMDADGSNHRRLTYGAGEEDSN